MQEQMNLLNSYQEFDVEGFGAPQGQEEVDVVSHILHNLPQIAYCDFKQDNHGFLSTEGQQVMKIMQFAMQYYMFAQKHLTNKALTLDSYLSKQKAHLHDLNQIKNIKTGNLPQKRKNYNYPY